MHEADLLAAVLARPDDDEPRLVYADWLQERDDPRGELIALQIQLTRMPAADPEARWLRAREKVLFDTHGVPWRAAFGLGADVQLAWSRGFVEKVSWVNDITAPARFVADAPELLACAPVRIVELTGPVVGMPHTFRAPFERAAAVELARSPWLLRVATLRYVAGPGAGDVAVASSEGLQHATTLIFDSCADDRFADALVQSPHVERVQSLHLPRGRLGSPAKAALTARFGERVRF